MVINDISSQLTNTHLTVEALRHSLVENGGLLSVDDLRALGLVPRPELALRYRRRHRLIALVGSLEGSCGGGSPGHGRVESH